MNGLANRVRKLEKSKGVGAKKLVFVNLTEDWPISFHADIGGPDNVRVGYSGGGKTWGTNNNRAMAYAPLFEQHMERKRKEAQNKYPEDEYTLFLIGSLNPKKEDYDPGHFFYEQYDLDRVKFWEKEAKQWGLENGYDVSMYE
jgi:hypothetical protein